MKKIEEIKEEEKKENTMDLPIASLVIKEFKENNDTLKESNKRLTTNNRILSIIVIILLVLFAIETTYIVIYWDTLHPYAGAIRKENSE